MVGDQRKYVSLGKDLCQSFDNPLTSSPPNEPVMNNGDAKLRQFCTHRSWILLQIGPFRFKYHYLPASMLEPPQRVSPSSPARLVYSFQSDDLYRVRRNSATRMKEIPPGDPLLHSAIEKRLRQPIKAGHREENEDEVC